MSNSVMLKHPTDWKPGGQMKQCFIWHGIKQFKPMRKVHNLVSGISGGLFKKLCFGQIPESKSLV